MALGPKNPKQQKALVVILLGAGLVFGVFQYVYSPRMTEVEAVASRVDNLELSNQRARVLAARGGGDIEEQLALYERHVLRLEELIPANEEVPGLIRTITAEGRRLGVEVAFIGPEPEVVGDFYNKQSYTMRAIGEFHSVGQFLTAIASLPRIITPVNLELVRFDDPQQVYSELEAPVLATFVIETYVLPSSPGGPPPVEAETEDAA